MKRIRLGNDIAITWTVTAGSPVDLSEAVITLIDQYGEKCSISDVTTTATGTTIYQYAFSFYGKDQARQGVYRILLQRNEGGQGMVTLDHADAFQLVGVCDFGIVEGNDEDNVVTVALDLSSTISTSVEGEGFDPEQYYTKDQTDVLLSAKENTLNYYSEDESSTSATIECGNASMDVEAVDGGTIHLKATHTTIEDGEGNNILVGAGGTSGISVETANGYKLTYNGGEVATKNDIPSPITVDDDLSTTSENPVQNKIITVAIGNKQDTIQDLSTIRSGAAAGATALQDAPADGQQYARKDHEWVPVEATGGGGGSLAIVEVAAGTTAIAAEADTYYKVAGQATNLAVTLPTMDDATKTAKCLFLVTAGSNPSITFGTAQSGATLAYFDGYSIGGGYTYIIQAEWAGGVWQMREVRQSGGIGPSGQGEQVTVVLMKKSGDSVTTISSGANVIVTVDGTATVYTTNVSGEVSFVVPYGYTYTVEAARRNGQYISGNAYTQTYTAGQTERTITFVFRSYESGLFITTEDGTDYTLEQWEEAVTAGTRENSEALYIHVVTSAFVDRSATFLIKIDHLRDRSYGGTTQWCTTNVQFNTIALNGTGDYDGATQTTKVITEATQRGLSVPAFTRCRNLYETVGGVRADGFLGAYQQWQFLWNNKAEVDDILVYTRPSGQYTFSSLTTNKWTSSQSNASNAYFWASAAGNSGKNGSCVVVPFFAF